MARSRSIVPFLAILAFVTGPHLVQALTIKYCASTNTAATATNSSIWQSNGLCHDFCVDQSFAFAILQDHDCWCSDYVPAVSSQVDTDECDDSCPGWQPDTCGADGLYGYIALDTRPSGTAGGTTAPTSTGHSSTTIVDTSSTVTSTVKSVTTTTSTSTTSSTLPDTSSSSKTTSTTISTPTTSVKTITTGGVVSLQTVTVTPTPEAGSGSNPEADDNTSSHGLNSGAAAGIAIGVLALVAIIVGIAVFFYLQRKRRRHEELISRPHSHLSGSQGIMSTPTTTMASVWDGENTSAGRRSSRLMPHDPRMDPFATNIYTRFENKSRESINTLQDNQDYSRKVLRTTNPDPPDE